MSVIDAKKQKNPQNSMKKGHFFAFSQQ